MDKLLSLNSLEVSCILTRVEVELVSLFIVIVFDVIDDSN
jgi:hypothetical protein